jgi:hypothetical protein
MGPLRRHTAQGGDAFGLLEMNILWCEMCKSIPEQQQMLEATGKKVSIYTVKMRNTDRLLYHKPYTGHKDCYTINHIMDSQTAIP